MARSRRRRSAINLGDEALPKVTVSITWDCITNAAYRVSFTNIGRHWSKCEIIITFIKQTIPTSQREYDPDLKMWFVGESYIQSIVDMCSAIPDFDVCFTPKPEEVFTTKMHSKEEDYATFKRMLSLAHIEFSDCNLTDFKYAKRAYLRAAMQLHPDRAPDMAAEMSTLNETWTRLQHSYFKDGGQSE